MSSHQIQNTSQPWDRVLETLWRRSRFVSYFYQSVQFIPSQGIVTLALTLSASRLVLLYEPAFVEQTGTEHLIGLLVHEMLHIVFQHDHRAADTTDPGLANLAQDMVVNHFIFTHERTFFSRKDLYHGDVPRLVLPPRLPLIPRGFWQTHGPKDPTWEMVYKWLAAARRNPDYRLNKKLEGLPGEEEADLSVACQTRPHDFADTPGLNPDSGDRDRPNDENSDQQGILFCDVEDEILPTGIHLLGHHGVKPRMDAGLKRMIRFAARDETCREERMYEEIQGLMEAPVAADVTSWRRLMKSIIDYQAQSRDWRYTYGRFNRRYFDQGLYTPGRVFMEQQRITVVVDVSGSMVSQPGELAEAFGVVEALLGKYTVHLLCIDKEIFVPRKEQDRLTADKRGFKPHVYRKGDWRLLKSGTSGTTFFAPLFNHYMRHHREMLVVITDGRIYDLDRLRPYSPTLWVVSSRNPDPFKPPFGKVVRVCLK